MKRLADSRDEPASWAMSACVIVDEHVAGAGALALRLAHEPVEHHRDAALDRLEGLAGEALVGLAQAPAERDDELDRDVGVLAQQAAHVGAQDGDRVHVVERLDRGRAQLVVEHRQLAEDVARAEVRERDDAPVGVLAHGAGVAGAHDVAGVAGVALAEDDVVAGERARNRDLDHALQVVGRQRLEDRHLPQESDALLCSGHVGRLNGLGAVGLLRSAGRRRRGGGRRAPRRAWRSRSGRPAPGPLGEVGGPHLQDGVGEAELEDRAGDGRRRPTGFRPRCAPTPGGRRARRSGARSSAARSRSSRRRPCRSRGCARCSCGPARCGGCAG